VEHEAFKVQFAHALDPGPDLEIGIEVVADATRHSADRIASDGREQGKARSLYDMTFSAPKSVSVMAIVGGETRLVAAHETAVPRHWKKQRDTQPLGFA
jgi:hypothetical protein